MNEDTHPPSSPNLDEEEVSSNIYYLPSMAAGSWANHADVMYSVHEFTIDFARMNIEGDPNEGVLVHRVNVSPWVAMRLAEQLRECIEDFSNEYINQESRSQQNLKEEED